MRLQTLKERALRFARTQDPGQTRNGQRLARILVEIMQESGVDRLNCLQIARFTDAELVSIASFYLPERLSSHIAEILDARHREHLQ